MEFKCAVVCLILSCAACLAAESRWVLLIEPSFTENKMRRPIEGSERTVLVMARVMDGETVPLTRTQKAGIPVTFAMIEADARQGASAVFARQKPVYVRDRHGVIDYALIESDDPLTATCVLAPEFGEKFSKTLGPDILVAVPNRNQVFVFSKQDDAYQRMGEAVVQAYLSSNHPVSREIFAWEKGRLRSLGLYQ